MSDYSEIIRVVLYPSLGSPLSGECVQPRILGYFTWW